MSDRLLWLQELSVTIVISDLNGANSYLLGSPKHQRVSYVHLCICAFHKEFYLFLILMLLFCNYIFLIHGEC